VIGLDTNVLLRILVDDGSPNVAVARRFAVEQVERGERLFLDRVVLAEIEWVLASIYGYARAQIAAAIHAVLENGAYEVEDRPVVHAAWEKFRDGSADFSDCLIAAKHATAGCAFTATFDRGMRGLPTTRVLR
jgi:predicted nucleic-acid-binding protein